MASTTKTGVAVRLIYLLTVSPALLSLAEAETAEVCQGRRFRLTCPGGDLIHLLQVILADSGCFGSSSCCPDADDCTSEPTVSHKQTAEQSCNGQTSCSLATERRKIPCGHFGFPVYNDYERILYRCVAPPTMTTPIQHQSSAITDTAAARDDVMTLSDATTSLSIAMRTISQPRLQPVIQSHHQYSWSYSQVLTVVGLAVILMFALLITVNVWLCRRYQHQRDHQLQQQVPSAVITSPDCSHMTTPRRSSIANMYESPSCPGAGAAAAGPVDTFYKPLMTCDVNSADDAEYYEDIDAYLQPVNVTDPTDSV